MDSIAPAKKSQPTGSTANMQNQNWPPGAPPVVAPHAPITPASRANVYQMEFDLKKRFPTYDLGACGFVLATRLPRDRDMVVKDRMAVGAFREACNLVPDDERHRVDVDKLIDSAIYYGLLRRPGSNGMKEIRLTPLGAKLLKPGETSANDRILAARKPQMHVEIVKHFGEPIPDDNQALRNYLMFERPTKKGPCLTEDEAVSFVEQLRETQVYAKWNLRTGMPEGVRERLAGRISVIPTVGDLVERWCDGLPMFVRPRKVREVMEVGIGGIVKVEGISLGVRCIELALCKRSPLVVNEEAFKQAEMERWLAADREARMSTGEAIEKVKSKRLAPDLKQSVSEPPRSVSEPFDSSTDQFDLANGKVTIIFREPLGLEELTVLTGEWDNVINTLSGRLVRAAAPASTARRFS